ncbi:DUF2218 domain-containing protein [Fertoebacter nigrum]|uniref:DUF2218 domain-containing protein n=1 Tax=Fertoeibacter niger TaxID=2656921 RepID=A0A8X8KQC4_9RHOB|nr:DUF2218 domain-containing protein [Fertoeibacter niger]NUB45801.1 DUF2218 domain-containing protein [Fertoeibacter niger]
MPLSRTDIATPKAQSYLQQLCKHFGHKIPVDFTPEAGSISFPFGTCRMTADATTLTITVEAGADDLERMEGVIQSHLERFAFREELVFDWQRETA